MLKFVLAIVSPSFILSEIAVVANSALKIVPFDLITFFSGFLIGSSIFVIIFNYLTYQKIRENLKGEYEEIKVKLESLLD